MRVSECSSLFGLCLVSALLLNACGDGTNRVPTYMVSGTVSGLAAGVQVILQLNGNTTITVKVNGALPDASVMTLIPPSSVCP